MKNRVLGIVCLLLICNSTYAQINWTWNEWFKQKKTQIKYLGQSIVELQAYLELVKKGYKLVDQGVTLINQVKNGEFNLHDAFYLSLKLVNPKLRSYPAVNTTVDNHAFIARQCSSLQDKSHQLTILTDQERDLVDQTISRLRQDMNASLDELIQVLTDNKLELKDDERIQRIERLKEYSVKRVVFIKEFSGAVLSLAGDRSREAAEIGVLRNRYGLQ